MQKLTTTKKLIAASFLVGVMGLSSAPLGASAYSYHHDNWNWRSQNDYNRYNVSDRDAHYIAQHMYPGRHFERVDYRFRGYDRDYDVVFFDGCHVIVRADDGRVMRVYYDQ